jgi:hypothetical protein
MVKALMRFVILLLLIQFVTPAFAQDNTSENTVHEKTSIRSQHISSGICTNVFLNSEEKSEADDKSPVFTAELIDFTFLTTVLTHFHSRSDWDVSSLPLTHEARFTLNSSFLI